MSLSTIQVAALEWLHRHPSLTVDERGRWSAAWASDDAREDLQRFLGEIEADPAVATSADRGPYVTAETTPQVRKVTIATLVRKGYLVPVKAPFRRQNYGLSKAGIEALFRERSRHRGKTFRVLNDRSSRPRKAGLSEIKRRGGPKAARYDAKSHRRAEAHHRRIAETIEQSLEMWDRHVEEQQEEWRSRHAKSAEGTR